MSYYGFDDSPMRKKPQDYDLLKNGWRPLYRQIDPEFMWQLIVNDPWKLTQNSLNLVSRFADTLGRKEYAWWANILNVFSEDIRYNVDEFLHYITPEPPAPNQKYQAVLSAETPVTQLINRDMIPIDSVLRKLREITVFKVLELLPKPDSIIQYYEDRHFYYPVERFSKWDSLEIMGTVLGYWKQHDLWLEIKNAGLNQKIYTLMSQNLAPLVNKATYNLAVMLSGYQNRVGKIQSQYPISTFPKDIQAFTDAVQQEILDREQTAILVQGEPGTGKTAWTQAVAKEILAPLGYVIFILDHEAVEYFIPPDYLERIAIIINEADNLARDRASEIGQMTNKTERVLSLLDGTLYRSVIEEKGIQQNQRLVVLMTCNTTERLDPALLRKGRVDLSCEFTHVFV